MKTKYIMIMKIMTNGNNMCNDKCNGIETVIMNTYGNNVCNVINQ